MTLRVDVQCASDAPEVPPAARLRRFARAAYAAASPAGAAAQLCVRLVGEQEGAALNAAYRGAARATNVLSFPFEAAARVEPPLLGDVVVCAPVVAREAAEQGKALDAHYAHLVVHGVLHLLGHRHEDEPQAARMEALEREALSRLGYPDPYAVQRGHAP